ncbi:hypothetical protein AB6A40_003882 [Gnathostoma spinigerum]|uniref:C3H1-type domain-containing protein n=1 Tax=Gnathostoma spinigerum TaxID=75299 RepID=A0ABD6EJM3_9BILA
MQSPTISSNTPQPKNPKLYKTELCRSWMDHGHCNYGDRCQYAHGEHEKRPIPRHPKYKTAYCQSFHQSGYCPYGPRCHFIHSEEPSTLNSQRSNRFTSNGGIVSPMTTNGFMITINGMSSSAAQQRACSSAGESPVPSSAGSGTESPNGSSSPSIDLDDSSGILSGGSWSTFIDAPRNIRRSHFEWPTPLSSEIALLDSSASQMAKSFGATPSQIPFDASISMMNDFMSWSLDEKQLSPKASSSSSGSGSICESTGRLPVFAQFSNSSAST